MKSRAPLPVPSGAQPLQNGHSRNLSGLDMAARSPPNQSSKAPPPAAALSWIMISTDSTWWLVMERLLGFVGPERAREF